MKSVSRAAQAVELFGTPMTCAVILAAFLLPAHREIAGEDSLPQVVRGDGVLAVAFGDAREVFGRAMVQKADSYFHGGIDIDCHVAHEGHDEHHHHGIDCDCDECRHEHEEHGHHESCDPWAWINAHVRAPQVHRHLEGEKSVEIIPWLWASVTADPHNIESWTTAAYVAGDLMKDGALALRILKEGEERNPKSVRLRFYEGRARYDRGNGDVKAALSAFETARDLALLQGLPSLSEEELQAYHFSTNFIAQIQR